MATAFEKTVSATEFKAKCLELMDQLGQRKLDRIIVTKRGRVVMEAVPPSLPLKSKLPGLPPPEKPPCGFSVNGRQVKSRSVTRNSLRRW